MPINYNSWERGYKHPFGAIRQNKRGTFTIDAPYEHVKEVRFIIRKEGGERGVESYPMTEVEPGRYSFTYIFNQGEGLYFYYFKISQEENGGVYTQYYGSKDGRGGQGRVYSEEKAVVSYQVTCFSQSEAAPEWYREAVVYQIFPDRFYNGDPFDRVLNPKPNTFLYGNRQDEPYYVKDAKGEIVRWDFHGGNLEGIIKKIPYLKKLGITCLYLNPIFEARSNHRYDTADYFEIDPVLGDKEMFRELVARLHQEGIAVILDGVFSHVGKNSRYFNFDGEYGQHEGAYRDPESPYRSWFKFDHYPTEYKSWWGVTDLPEVDKYNPNFQEFIYGKDGVIDYWSDFQIDGWRLDVADELPDAFIAGIRQRLEQQPGKILIGEVWEDASKKIAYDERRSYILGKKLQGVMNYPFRETILAILQKNATQTAAEELTTLQENYPKEVFYNNLNNIGSHDTERILTMVDNNTAKVNLAVGLMCMLPGIPCIYYGDEAGLTGGKDPMNRKFYPWDHEDHTIMKDVEKWIKVRKENPILQYGDFIPFYTDTLFGIFRFMDYGYVLYVVNPTGQEQVLKTAQLRSTRPLPLPEDKLQQLLDGAGIKAYDGYFLSEKIDIMF
ncbi:hypothetical protein RU97_GL000045 [Enterococcus canis]|uniref:Glycosyl hydrolase family 13 catalytic domain-containing protein n=1 Tax=Enterococcus canis TaxID=214095 RepID=A0A1L8RJC6_9ENTE|nr:glycoside hydrolase family 13 protein [Enterococcus canis]OJG19812.1 hypothetical protein RU97_GL000045 [Enterococcus canis]